MPKVPDAEVRRLIRAGLTPLAIAALGETPGERRVLLRQVVTEARHLRPAERRVLANVSARRIDQARRLAGMG